MKLMRVSNANSNAGFSGRPCSVFFFCVRELLLLRVYIHMAQYQYRAERAQ